MEAQEITASQAWQRYWNCYQIATQAQTAFTAETVRQFGKRSGDMRYVSAAFDYATNCAAVIKQRADADMHSALESARAFPVVERPQSWTPQTARQRVGGTFGS